MAYATSGLIQASDFNGFANNNTPNVNAIWSTGSGNSGYGQTALSTVSQGSIIAAQSTFNLLQNVIKSATHQGTIIAPFTNGSPTPGTLIIDEPNLAGNINLINTNRLNAAVQGSTSATTATSVTTWSNTLTITFTVTFASHNNARYFFNAGGQLGFTFAHPTGTGANATVSTLCSDTGSVWLSSPTAGAATLTGIPYNGVTKIGGANPSGATINTNNGFYALTGSLVQLFRQDATSGYYYYYGSTYLKISASYNGSGVLTIQCMFEEGGGGYYYYGGTVGAGTQATLTLRPPSTTVLTNTWGTPGISSTIVAT